MFFRTRRSLWDRWTRSRTGLRNTRSHRGMRRSHRRGRRRCASPHRRPRLSDSCRRGARTARTRRSKDRKWESPAWRCNRCSRSNRPEHPHPRPAGRLRDRSARTRRSRSPMRRWRSQRARGRKRSFAARTALAGVVTRTRPPIDRMAGRAIDCHSQKHERTWCHVSRTPWEPSRGRRRDGDVTRPMPGRLCPRDLRCGARTFRGNYSARVPAHRATMCLVRQPRHGDARAPAPALARIGRA
jgi:hypothetical protein